MMRPFFREVGSRCSFLFAVLDFMGHLSQVPAVRGVVIDSSCFEDLSSASMINALISSSIATAITSTNEITAQMTVGPFL